MGQTKETRKKLTTSYDRIIKAGLEPYYGDVAAWLLGARPAEVRTVDTALVTPVERLADKILEVRFSERGTMLLHVELSDSGSSIQRRSWSFGRLVFGPSSR